MGDISENRPQTNLCVGLLAHVDAGKTTLSEGMLFEAGAIRSLGRVEIGRASCRERVLDRV